MTILSRLIKLEQLSAGKIKHFATVLFSDGTKRRMAAQDVILLLHDPNNIVADVSGGGPGDGCLIELLKGLIEP